MCATNQICQKSNRSVVLEPQSIHSLSANPGHHVGAYKLVVCDQENGAPSSLSSSQGPWYLPRWNRPWAFLIYPSVIMPKLNSEQIHGSASSLHPSGSTSWIVDKKKKCQLPLPELSFREWILCWHMQPQNTRNTAPTQNASLKAGMSSQQKLTTFPYSQFWTSGSEILPIGIRKV